MKYRNDELTNRLKEDVLGDGGIFGDIKNDNNSPELIRDITGVLLTVGLLALPALMIGLINN